MWDEGVGVNPLMAVACRTFRDPIPLRRQQADLSLHNVYMWATLVAVWFIDVTNWIVFDERNNNYNHSLLTNPFWRTQPTNTWSMRKEYRVPCPTRLLVAFRLLGRNMIYICKMFSLGIQTLFSKKKKYNY